MDVEHNFGGNSDGDVVVLIFPFYNFYHMVRTFINNICCDVSSLMVKDDIFIVY